jgi:outer membrane cobalamin receptor
LIISLSFSKVKAENISSSDSVKVRFPEVEVKADRILSDRALMYSPVSSISLIDIQKIGAMQVSEAISSAPGVFIKNYGGLGGMKTVSLRGTTSMQTLIMLDGVKLNSSQNGLMDLSIFPLSILDNIEVIRGGTSALFGGNAIGGVVNLRTKIKDDYSLSGKLSRGSFNEWNTAVNFTIPIYLTPTLSQGEGENKLTPSLSKGEGDEHLYFQGNIEYTKSEGNYPFISNQFGTDKILHRNNADFENLNCSLFAESEINNWSFTPKIFFRSSVRGTPGAVVQGNVIDSNARLNEKELLLILQTKIQINTNTSIMFSLSGRLNRLNYNDTTAFGNINSGINNTFFNKDIMLSGRLSSRFGSIISDFNMETGFSDLNGDMLQAGVGRYVSRNYFAISNREETDFSLSEFLKLSMQGGLRLDAISNIGTALSPILGFILSSPDLPLKLRSQWSYNFRPPSFNEMYYLNYGTSTLKPERSNSYNLGINYVPLENLSVEAEGFIISTKDQILSIPKSPVTWSAQNIGSVLTKGFEFNIKSNIFKNLIDINFSYTRQIATDESAGAITYGEQIVYVPQEIISFIGVLNFNYFSVGMTAQYSSYYYCLPDNSYSSINPSSFVMNIFACEEIKISTSVIKIRFDCNNLFDEQYCIIKNYPMPGRSFRVGINYEI